MISSTIRRAGPFVGTGIETHFPFAFKVFDATDVEVTHTDAAGEDDILASGYVVTLNADQEASPGGYVTTTDPLPTDEKITLTSDVIEEQPMQLTNGGGFFPSVLNDSADRSVILIQQLREKLDRAIVVPLSDDTSLYDMTLPSLENRKGMLLGFDDITGGFMVTASYAAIVAAAASAASDRELAQEAAQQATAAVIGAMPIRIVTADYTITAADLGFLLWVDAASNTNVYIPNGLPGGFWCDVEQYGAGSVFLLPNDTAILNSLSGSNKITGRYGIARVIVQQPGDIVTLSQDISGAGSVGWIVGAPRIRKEGFVLEVDLIASRATGSIDYTKLVNALAVTSEGYTCTAGNPGTVTLGTFVRHISVTKILRMAYAAQASDQVVVTGDLVTISMALSEPVYNDDCNGGAGTSGVDPKFSPAAGWWVDGPRTAPPEIDTLCSNLSLEDYPLPNMGWNITPFLISSDYSNAFPLGVVGCGPDANNGCWGIAGVQFTCTGIGNSSASLVTPVTASGHVETRVVTDIAVATGDFATLRTVPSLSFKTSVSDTSFTAKEKVRKDFKAYPVLGDTPLDSSTYTPWTPSGGSIRPWSYTDICDNAATYGRLYVCVDRTAGNDGSTDGAGVYTPGANGGQVYTSRAAAIAGKAFLTNQKAAYVLQQQSTIQCGRTEIGNHYFIASGAGNYDQDMGGTSANPPRLTFTLEDCGVQDTWTFYDRSAAQVMVANASTGSKCGAPKTCNLIPMATTSTGNLNTCWDCKDGSSATVHFWNKNNASTGQSDSGSPLHKGAGYYYITGCSYTNPGALLRAPSTNNASLMLIRDTDILPNQVAGAPFVANGLFVSATTQAVLGEPNAAGSSPKIDGCVAINVAILKHSGTSSAQGYDTVRVFGSALCNILLEGISASSIPGMGINRDGNLNNTKNHFWYDIALYGETLYRLNTHYEDATTLSGGAYATDQLKKGHWFKGNVIGNINIKSDVFAQNANNVHNWNVIYHVGFSYNMFLYGDAQATTIPGRGVHLGEIFNRGESVASSWVGGTPNSTQIEAIYANDIRPVVVTWKASAALGGSTTIDNYVPSPGGKLTSKMPANQWPCKYDLKGLLRKNDGTGAIGPLRAAAEA